MFWPFFLLLEQFFLTVSQNNFWNKILCIVKFRTFVLHKPLKASCQFNCDQIKGITYCANVLIENKRNISVEKFPIRRDTTYYAMVNLLQFCGNSPFYKVIKILQKRLCAWRNFKIIFSRPLFIIKFRTKRLFSAPYSILTRYTKVESVAY